MIVHSASQRPEAVVDARLDGARFFLIRTRIDCVVLRDVLLHPERHWRQAELPSGRTVFTPSFVLRRLQERFFLALRFRLAEKRCEEAITAFRPGMSHIENAKRHAHPLRRSSLMLDLRDAFGSVTRRQIESFLHHNQIPRDEAWIASRLWTHEGRLRQGASVAPELFNLVMTYLDHDIFNAVGATAGIQNVHDLKDVDAEVMYTRFADNLCFSSRWDTFPEDEEALIREVVQKHQLVLNEKKTIRGSNGVLHFPGVTIRDGVIGPNDHYIRRAMQVLAETTDYNVVCGHRAYMQQFHTSTIPAKLRHLLERKFAATRSTPLSPKTPR